MRLQVTTSAGLTYGGRLYRRGEELEMPDDDRNRRWALVFVARHMAKRSEPVVLGTPPRPPAPTPSPESTPTPDVPAPDAQKVDPWIQSPWETAALEPQSDAAPEGETSETEGQPLRRRRYARRDLRPEE